MKSGPVMPQSIMSLRGKFGNICNDPFDHVKSYRQGYCDWVGFAKQEETRKASAEKAMAMLRNKQKILKT
jgi:hypothetical protein